MGDVDPLGELEAVGAGDVGVVLAQQGPPGELDGLRARVARYAEAGVEVVGRERRAGRHVADDRSRAGRGRLAMLRVLSGRQGVRRRGRSDELHQAGPGGGSQAAEAARSARTRRGRQRTANDPATRGGGGAQAPARPWAWPGAASRRSIERIDPGTLAELIVKATALQEMTNASLRQKGSPYRIAEISISASIPPAVSFAISRVGDEPEEEASSATSSHRASWSRQAAEAGDLVLALDGTTVDEATVATPGVEAGPASPAAELDLAGLAA